jgi:hypothetical protein
MAADDDEMMEPDEEIELEEAEELDGPDLDVAELDEDELEGELEEADDEFGVIDDDIELAEEEDDDDAAAKAGPVRRSVASEDDPAWPVISKVARELAATGVDASAQVAPTERANHKCGQLAAVVATDDREIVVNADADVAFDETLLDRLRLTGKRLVFLTECLADLGQRREVQVWRGDPVEVLAGGGVATTFAPVPGWRRRSSRIEPDEIHPWAWLARPHAGSAGSFSAWRKGLERS